MTLINTLFLTAFPHGGQQAARRNAWAAMSADSARARTRREADAALVQAALAASRPERAAAAH